jgi:hypothetical protein
MQKRCRISTAPQGRRAVDALKIIVLHSGLEKRFDELTDLDRKIEWAVANQGQQLKSKNDNLLKLGFLCREMYYDPNIWVVLAKNPSYLYFGMLSFFRDAKRFDFLFNQCSALFTQTTLNYFITECFNYMFCSQRHDSSADKRYHLLGKLLNFAKRRNYNISFWASTYYYRRQISWALVTQQYALGPYKNLDHYFDLMMVVITQFSLS